MRTNSWDRTSSRSTLTGCERTRNLHPKLQSSERPKGPTHLENVELMSCRAPVPPQAIASTSHADLAACHLEDYPNNREITRSQQGRMRQRRRQKLASEPKWSGNCLAADTMQTTQITFTIIGADCTNVVLRRRATMRLSCRPLDGRTSDTPIEYKQIPHTHGRVGSAAHAETPASHSAMI